MTGDAYATDRELFTAADEFLWGIALCRLLIPISIASEYSVYSFAKEGVFTAGFGRVNDGETTDLSEEAFQEEGGAMGESAQGQDGILHTALPAGAEGFFTGAHMGRISAWRREKAKCCHLAIILVKM